MLIVNIHDEYPSRLTVLSRQLGPREACIVIQVQDQAHVQHGVEMSIAQAEEVIGWIRKAQADVKLALTQSATGRAQ